MKYMLLVYTDEAVWSEEERQRCYTDSLQFANRLHQEGKCLAAAPLHSVASATSVRIEGNKTRVTDGPFAETREQLGGYYLIVAADLDEAISISAQIPVAAKGTIEIRPVVELPDFSNRTE